MGVVHESTHGPMARGLASMKGAYNTNTCNIIIVHANHWKGVRAFNLIKMKTHQHRIGTHFDKETILLKQRSETYYNAVYSGQLQLSYNSCIFMYNFSFSLAFFYISFHAWWYIDPRLNCVQLRLRDHGIYSQQKEGKQLKALVVTSYPICKAWPILYFRSLF